MTTSIRTAGERRRYYLALGDAIGALNPYKAQYLSDAWRRGFNISATGRPEGGPIRGREGTAYFKGYAARREAQNIERFPVIVEGMIDPPECASMTDLGLPIIPVEPPAQREARLTRQRAEHDAWQLTHDEGQAYFYAKARVEYVERGVKALTPVEVGYVDRSRGIWPTDFVAACERRLNREADAEEAENGPVTERPA